MFIWQKIWALWFKINDYIQLSSVVYLRVARIDSPRKNALETRGTAGDLAPDRERERERNRTRRCAYLPTYAYMHELSGVSHKQRTKCTCCQVSARDEVNVRRRRALRLHSDFVTTALYKTVMQSGTKWRLPQTASVKNVGRTWRFNLENRLSIFIGKSDDRRRYENRINICTLFFFRKIKN